MIDDPLVMPPEDVMFEGEDRGVIYRSTTVREWAAYRDSHGPYIREHTPMLWRWLQTVTICPATHNGRTCYLKRGHVGCHSDPRVGGWLAPLAVRAMEFTPKPVDLTRRHPPRMATLRKTSARLVREVRSAGEGGVRVPDRLPSGWRVESERCLSGEHTAMEVIGPRLVHGSGLIRHGTRLDHVRDLTPPGLTILADDATGDDVAADR